MQKFKGWEDFRERPLRQKFQDFSREGEIYHLIYAQQLTREFTSNLFALADKIRTTAKSKEGKDFMQTVCSDKRAMLFFVQPSTRTFLSFLNACHVLGIKTSEIRDTKTSSELKGESQEDAIRTFSSYVDMIIVRHNEEGFAEKSAWVLNQSRRPVPIINGGSGKDEHPTQALLDLYTINRSFKKRGGIDGKKIAMVGDLKRGRTIRSLSQLLTNYENIELFFVAPDQYQMRGDILEYLRDKNVPYTLSNDFESVIPMVDTIYCTRIQDEYDEDGESKKVDYTKFHFTEDHLKIMKEDAIIMHPFPRRAEIDVEVDKDSRAKYWDQARNGMWIRAALIVKVLGRERTVLDHSNHHKK